MSVASWWSACFCAVLCDCFCTGTFVMVPLNLTWLHCFNMVFFNISSIYILNGPFYYTCVGNPHVSFRIVKNNENGDFTPESFGLNHYSSCFTKPDSFTTLLYLVIRYQHTAIAKNLEMTEWSQFDVTTYTLAWDNQHTEKMQFTNAVHDKTMHTILRDNHLRMKILNSNHGDNDNDVYGNIFW